MMARKTTDDPTDYGLDYTEVIKIESHWKPGPTVVFTCYSRNMYGEHWLDFDGNYATHQVTHPARFAG